jgi:hypothetical protein
MKNQLLKTVFTGLFFLSLTTLVYGQKNPDPYQGGMKVKLTDDGAKYFRIISWAQMQGVYTDNVAANTSNVNLNLRRARVLMYSQISKKFLILTHFGLNSLNGNTMSPVGKGSGSQLFFHDVWVQYSLGENHAVGGGLHYFNGISRLNNQSTLNMLTMDNNRQSWSTIGLSDQFARHLGVFGKGSFGKLQYRLAINDAVTTGLDTRDPEMDGSAVYGGKRLLGSATANFTYAGYFDYHFLDEESNFLPFKVGSYLGAKKIFNIGAGFFAHPNGSAIATDTIGGVAGQNVSLFAGDAFFEMPIGDNNGAISIYGTYQYNDYGRDYLFSAYGTGSMIYGHVGYVIPGDKSKTRFQPYVSFANNTYDATTDARNIIGAGINAYFTGHHSKLTLDYKNQQFGATQTNTVSVQAMIFL